MAEIPISRKKLLQWLAMLTAIGKLFKDFFGDEREPFKCACVPVEEVIKRHSKQVPDTCKVSDGLPTKNK